ncbi:hypothetical protein EI94DRAFT_783710 [Lactarius quietus]|nr:hypothetical protein EI94DRAFT_783710 [Lactarius quietus]
MSRSDQAWNSSASCLLSATTDWRSSLIALSTRGLDHSVLLFRRHLPRHRLIAYPSPEFFLLKFRASTVAYLPSPGPPFKLTGTEANIRRPGGHHPIRRYTAPYTNLETCRQPVSMPYHRFDLFLMVPSLHTPCRPRICSRKRKLTYQCYRPTQYSQDTVPRETRIS